MGDYVDADGVGQNFTPDQLDRIGEARESDWRRRWRAGLPLEIPTGACDAFVAERLILALRGREGFDRTEAIFLDLYGDPARDDGVPRGGMARAGFCLAASLAISKGYVEGGRLPFNGVLCPILFLSEKGIGYAREIAAWEKIEQAEADYARP